MEIEAKINKWDLIKLKSFCPVKETIDKMKRQPTDWETIFANHETNKGLFSKIDKQLIQLNIKNTAKHRHPVKKCAGLIDVAPEKACAWPVAREEVLSAALREAQVGAALRRRRGRPPCKEGVLRLHLHVLMAFN